MGYSFYPGLRPSDYSDAVNVHSQVMSIPYPKKVKIRIFFSHERLCTISLLLMSFTICRVVNLPDLC